MTRLLWYLFGSSLPSKITQNKPFFKVGSHLTKLSRSAHGHPSNPYIKDSLMYLNNNNEHVVILQNLVSLNPQMFMKLFKVLNDGCCQGEFWP